MPAPWGARLHCRSHCVSWISLENKSTFLKWSMLIWVLLTPSEEGMACSVPAGWIGIQGKTGFLPKNALQPSSLWEPKGSEKIKSTEKQGETRGRDGTVMGTMKGNWICHGIPAFLHLRKENLPLSLLSGCPWPPIHWLLHKRLPHPIAYTLHLLYSSKSYLRDYHCSF